MRLASNMLLEKPRQIYSHVIFARAIDDWIKILDNWKLILDAKLLVKSTKDAETTESIAWRTASLAK